MKDRCVVVLSGGPDSVTAAYWSKAEGFDVYSVTFNYGQKAQIEIKRAREIADNLGIHHKVIDISKIGDIYEGVTSLVDNDMTISSKFSDSLIVPFRNGVFLAITVAYSDAIRAYNIFYGSHADDEPFYPDCRKEFYKAFEKAAKLGTEKPIVITSPFSNLPKSGILKKAVELNVPLELTWSCYLDGPDHCGVCESCNNRKNAFKEAGIDDLTSYVQ